MRRFFWGTAILLVVLVLVSGWGTYPVWWVVEQWIPGRYHMQRVFNRVLMLTALAMMPLLAWYWKVGWRELGIRAPLRVAGRDGCRWMVAGVLMIAVLAGWSALWGHRDGRMELTWARAVGHLFSGVSVAVAEEIIFRGLFFYAAWRVLAPRGAIFLALAGSAVFASLHFFVDVRGQVGVPAWDSGWIIWREWAELMLAPEAFARRWLALFAAGLVLCALVYRQGHVWGAVGLHAGWVFALKTAHRLSQSRGEESVWFAPDLFSGWWAIIMLLGVLGWLLLASPKEKSG